MSALVDQLRKIQADAVTAPEKEQVGRCIAAAEAAETGPDLRIQAYALGRAHANQRTAPSTHDWAVARSWFSRPDLEECSKNPDRDHAYTTAQDGDGQPLDYQHCGYCGKRRPS